VEKEQALLKRLRNRTMDMNPLQDQHQRFTSGRMHDKQPGSLDEHRRWLLIEKRKRGYAEGFVLPLDKTLRCVTPDARSSPNLY
jgi:hypothetical protein